ncbi:MAG: TIGR04211 family SH3 domain-containing protein [Desulfobacterales bacterium]|nr:MAG: TIGR04211 family SH3 domain-containing protein [Desulfobacterales bacterium]
MKPIIKVFVAVWVFLIFLSPMVLAETNYISDSMKITMRTEPGKDRKIIALLNIGQKVDVLSPGDDWTLVQLPNGKKGFVLSRFLTNKTPSSIELNVLQNKHESLQANAASLLEENNAFKSKNEALTTELAATRKELQDLKNDFAHLKKGSAHFLELQKKYKTTTSKLEEQTKKAGQFEDELNKLIWNQNIKWFLSGAGVLLIGFLIGLSTKRQRRRPTLL